MDMNFERRDFIKFAGGVAFVFALLPRAAMAARNSIRAIRTGVQPNNRTRLVIETQIRPNHTIQNLNNPPRLVVNLANTPVNNNIRPNLANGTLVTGIRQNQIGDRAQIVADLTRPITTPTGNQIQILPATGDHRFRLVIDFAASGAAPVPAATATAPATQTGGTARAATRRPIIVIDPGHGGRDPGAIGRGGVREKDIVLTVGRKLRTSLNNNGFDAHLTRNSDIFLNLNTRARIAEERNADMFISLHANANPSPNFRGFSIFTLSQQASDQEAARLAELENAADLLDVDGFENFEQNVRRILSSLQQGMLTEESVQFAHGVRRAKLAQNIVQQPNGSVRRAPFAVLRANTPSVLIELGHLSHREEERLLNQAAHQNRLVRAITNALRDHEWHT